MNASNKQIHTLLFDQLTNLDYPDSFIQNVNVKSLIKKNQKEWMRIFKLINIY